MEQVVSLGHQNLHHVIHSLGQVVPLRPLALGEELVRPPTMAPGNQTSESTHVYLLNVLNGNVCTSPYSDLVVNSTDMLLQHPTAGWYHRQVHIATKMQFRIIATLLFDEGEPRSCLTNILEFMEDVTSSLNRQKSVDVVFLDFQKAFDKVPHQRPLLRLKEHGVNGNLLSWIGNWLGDREQRVVIKGCASSWQNVTSGVPQGSVLGPLLFVAYINDIDGDILCTAKKFADDTKLYSEVSSKSDSEKFQMDLDKIFSWSQGWQMLLILINAR
ncbi:putative RNA-directed DNA polymerase from mobile element jockey-like [Apostichopus japonicus]|uniref:Putative RNA-directed DNA polymerase from mobile element jockey-like n=1 Tax=Stichopus japonicus TaxID=307972 RepID=A0A2G8K676_STIJA|nr:putative RNA-directed DNA polymerase from mobile element jockey-like [Apostichopus japonicus]